MIVRAGVAKPENIAMPSRGKDERGRLTGPDRPSAAISRNE